ncbi:MAG TPA: PIG-L family deacetylase [Anaerolineales bacterium]|nr:PIG-L family deacetylase [Anaerolineales bacterium]
MRWIYLSPHLDDAVLSAGGLIYDQTQAGIPVEIWTFMCGYPPSEPLSPFADALHAQWGFSSAAEAVRARREEDRKAAAIVGAQVTHFDYLDCIYRRGANGESLYMEIYVPPHPEDASLAQNIADTISARILPDDMLVCQLSVGSHVDHVLVRQAAELLGHPLWYDIDIPYIFYKSEEFVSKSAQMRETTHFISNAGLRSWQEAVLQYASQLPALGEAMATSQYAQESILAYWSEWKGIRLFQER